MDVANMTQQLKAKLRIQLITFPSFIYSKHQCSYIQMIFTIYLLQFFCGMGSGHGPVSIFLSLGFLYFRHKYSFFNCQFHFFCRMGTARSDPADAQIAQQGLSGLGFLACLIIFSFVWPGIFSMFSSLLALSCLGFLACLVFKLCLAWDLLACLVLFQLGLRDERTRWCHFWIFSNRWSFFCFHKEVVLNAKLLCRSYYEIVAHFFKCLVQ